MRRKWLIVLIVLVVATAVSAKYEPYMEDPDAEWGSLGSSWAVPSALPFYGLFGHLDSAEDIDTFLYDFDEAVTAFSVRVIVPVCGTLFEDFYPSAAIIGPGFDVPEDLPFELPEGMGALVLTEIARTEPRPTIDDASYTHQDYFNIWHSVDIPAAGEYTIAVWEPDGRVGAYVLATGREHPEMDMRNDIREKERIAAYNQIESGSWMNADCAAEIS